MLIANRNITCFFGTSGETNATSHMVEQTSYIMFSLLAPRAQVHTASNLVHYLNARVRPSLLTALGTMARSIAWDFGWAITWRSWCPMQFYMFPKGLHICLHAQHTWPEILGHSISWSRAVMFMHQDCSECLCVKLNISLATSNTNCTSLHWSERLCNEVIVDDKF